MQVTANGITMHYLLDGPAGAPVVTLSHSLATDMSMWDPQLATLAERYRVLRYDTRGHGKTDAPAGPYSFDLLAADARALLAALKIAKTHWIGLSMGGMIGQALALSSPELLASLSLCDTASRMPPDMGPVWDDRAASALSKGMEALVEPTVSRWFTAPFVEQQPAAVDRVRTMIRTTPAVGYAACCAAIKPLNLTDRIGAITLPTLVIVGEQDPGTPVAASRVIQERIKGSELVVIPSASHLSSIEQPAAFNAAVMGFLSRLA